MIHQNGFLSARWHGHFNKLFLVIVALFFAFFLPSALKVEEINTSLVKTKTNNSTETEKKLLASLEVKLEQNDFIYGQDQSIIFHAPIVNEEYNVIFFQTPKVASTEWKRFFARLEGNRKWCISQNKIHKKAVNKLTLLSDYNIDEAERMMKSPKWKKVVFVRHPKPRLLSAFLDKAIMNSNYFIKYHCPIYAQNVNGTNKAYHLHQCERNHKDFAFFLKNFTSVPVVRDNMHWRSMYSRIDRKWWPYIDFVGKMEHLSEDVKQFLSSIHSNVDRVSAWDRIGRSGWGDTRGNKTSKDCHVASQSEGEFFGVRDPGHSTNAKVQMMKYYNIELEEILEKRYADDLDNPYFKLDPLKLYVE